MALSTTQYGYIIDPMVPFTDDKGKTIKNGFVRVFVAGSSTPVVTYRNFDGATNQVLIELDNSGRTKTSVIGSKGLTYKVCVYDAFHSQESPILTVDKVSAIGANITAGAGATVVTGLDGLTTKPDGFVDASVVGTDGYVALDHTLVTDDLDTDAKVTAVENDRYIPLLNKDVNDPDSKMTLGRMWQWVLGKIKSLPTTITAFRTGDYIAVDGTSGTAKMGKDDLLQVTAKNALGSIHSLSATATEADLVSGNYFPVDGSAGPKRLPAEVVAKSVVVGSKVEKTITWTGGRYIKPSTGGIGNSAGFSASGLISVVPGMRIRTNCFNFADEGYAFYSSDSYISGAKGSPDGVVVPENCSFLKISNYDVCLPSADVYLFLVTADSHEEQITEIDESLHKVENTVGADTPLRVFWKTGKYIEWNTGAERSFAGFNATEYIIVVPGTMIKTNTKTSANAGFAFYDENRSTITSAKGSPDGKIVPIGARFLRFSCADSEIDYNTVTCSYRSSNPNSLNNKVDFLYIPAHTYMGKTCMYIGDSISTSDECYWKGYIEKNYGLKYARNPSGIWPANRGITVVPYRDADSQERGKSIWYRCGQSRLSDVDFDVICIFGGTNDVNNHVSLGSVDDEPYLDISPEQETPNFAECLMGCIEMLQRDFPNKEIIIATLMPMATVGNYEIDGKNATQAYAELQLQVANKYGLKCVWLFDGVKTIENAPLFCKEASGVHPNQNGALRVMARFAETLSL